MDKSCGSCGMCCENPLAYHPFAACIMFKSIRNGNSVQANIMAVVEYGMKAQAAGVSLEEAMNNIHSVLTPPPSGKDG